jgi:lipopolysaccharide transport system permease protein
MNVYADVFRYRELFGSLFRRDLRAKYKGSVLGLAWTLALPVLLMLVYLVVFSVLWKAQPTEAVDDYWLFLLCGLPPWVFFASSLQSSARSLLENANLIRKVRFPRQLVPLSVVATQVVAFGVMLAVALVLSLVVLDDTRGTAWLSIPTAAVIVLFVGGLSLTVASVNAIFRDVEFIVTALLLPWFFLTPILYRISDLPGIESHPWLADVLQWGNPMTPVVEAFRAPLFAGEAPSVAVAVYLLTETVVALVLGALVFRSVDAVVRRQPAMLARLEPHQQAREHQRDAEPRVAAARGPRRVRPTSTAPGDKAVLGDDRRPHGRPSLLVRVEQPARPVGRRHGPGHEMRDRLGVGGHERLVLGGECGVGPGVGASVDGDTQTPRRDPGEHVDRDVERRAAELLQPEAVLLDEVEAEDVAAGRARNADVHGHVEPLAGGDGARERRPRPVPHDGVPERV